MEETDPTAHLTSALTDEERAAIASYAARLRGEGWQQHRDGNWYRPANPDIVRAIKGPRYGDERQGAEDMIADALVAAGLRAPNVRTYGLNSPEAHRALIPPYPDRPCRPRPQSDEVVRPWTDVVVPRGVGERNSYPKTTRRT